MDTTDRTRRLGRRRGWAAAAALVVLATLARTSAGREYIPEDIVLSGDEVHVFQVDGNTVTGFVGGFSMRMGRRRVSARDAVMWVEDESVAGKPRRSVHLYIEGAARIVEPDGATTTDEAMVLSLRQQGRLEAKGTFSTKSLASFPLFRRAREAMRAHRAQPAAPPAHPAPPLRITPARPPRRDRPRPPRRVEDTPPDRPDANAPPARSVEPVSVQAEAFHIRPGDPNAGEMRLIVGRGDVYLAQGNPDSELFLEIRSRGAVVFTGRRRVKDVRYPLSPQMPGLTDPADANGPEETITGAYLEGDVIIARGNRYVRCDRAFYDFTTDRAIVIEPVFRTIQQQRNIPIYIRAAEGRFLSSREMFFRDARVSTSDFYTPSYHVGVRRAYLMDRTPYDEQGERLGRREWFGRFHGATYNVRSVPIFYWPYAVTDFRAEESAIRRVAGGVDAKLGPGIETEWNLFRLLGLIGPEGFNARLDVDGYQRGFWLGASSEYVRPDYSGYAYASGLYDSDAEDDFGRRRQDVGADTWRGRLLARHKQYLDDGWQVQGEISYWCDRNFIEKFSPDEWYAGKEQENLLYAKKQKDNWAITALLKGRLNRFETSEHAAPDLGAHLVGEPLGEFATFYHESHAGLVSYGYDNTDPREDSVWMARLDTRNEIDLPFKLGPVNLVAYATGRASYWGDTVEDDGDWRPYGQAGVKINTHLWKVYDRAESRLLNVRRLRHVITPLAAGFLGEAARTSPEELYPISPDIEQHLRRQSGYAVGIQQRLQTKRGTGEAEHTVDWMRLDVIAGFYHVDDRGLPASDGRFYLYRPEYSIGQDHLNAEYTWMVSDATTVLAEMNYDFDAGSIKNAATGLAVARSPRLRYYVGWRLLDDLESSVGTAGVFYRVNSKYSLSAFQQYDFMFDGGRNLGTSATITRKFPRWYASITASYAQRHFEDDVTVMLVFWPEGIDEVRIQTGRLDVTSGSTRN